MKCPNCDYESAPEMRFCGMCGTALTRTCSNCQFVNPYHYNYCGMCGKPLAEGTALPHYSRFSNQPDASQRQSTAISAQKIPPPQNNGITGTPASTALE